MRRGLVFLHRRWLGLALGLAGWMLTAGCSSTAQLEGIQSQLADIQRQVLQVQTQGSSKREVEELAAVIANEVNKLLKSDADTKAEIDRLARQVERLQARLEDTHGRLDQLSQQTVATNEELKNLRTLLPRLLMGERSPQEPPPPPPTDPEQIYQAARNDYLQGNYELAILGFRQYVETFPDTDRADNASYWIGECYYSQGLYRQAIIEFNNVERFYPDSEKLASVLLKKGFSYLEIGDRARGVVGLNRVRSDYPESDEADLAQQRLDGLDPP